MGTKGYGWGGRFIGGGGGVHIGTYYEATIEPSVSKGAHGHWPY